MKFNLVNKHGSLDLHIRSNCIVISFFKFNLMINFYLFLKKEKILFGPNENCIKKLVLFKKTVSVQQQKE